MQLDSDDLLARIRQDYPYEYEICQLRALVDAQAREIERLNAVQNAPLLPRAGDTAVFSASAPRPYVTQGLDDEGRHGG